MKPSLIFISLISCASLSLNFQSGRKAQRPTVHPTPVVAETKSPTKEASTEPPPVTAEKNEEYRCTADGTLARILEPEADSELVFSSRAVSKRAVITDRPRPSYTREARRVGLQGFVNLKVVLSANGNVGRVRVVKPLPLGLTESAIHAACKIQFKPATKNGEPVSQWLNAEYVFRLADSSIFRP